MKRIQRKCLSWPIGINNVFEEREREEMLRHRYRDDIKESDVERRKMNQNYKT